MRREDPQVLQPEDALLPCFGVNCEKHGECEHYALVEGSDPLNGLRLYVCGKPGWRPLFVQRKGARESGFGELR